ncbi:MAG TPA: NAD-dependent epimerase/dehydratase family protein [Chloroflexota bacterium]|nr:NAD-dependent epimerase/dehydratase family protein [Chloroflexota bacterium]
MKIIITGGRSLLGQALEQALAGEHQVTLAPPGDLRDEAFAAGIVRGAEALIHLATLSPDVPHMSQVSNTPNGSSEREVLDLATRGTYVLLNAAAGAGVRRVITGSTLAMFEHYPEAWRPVESWQPLPDVTDPAAVHQLAAYLAEEATRHIARAMPIMAFCLRFGDVVDDAAIEGKPYDSRWVHVDDAVAAVRAALSIAPSQQRTPWPDPQSEAPQGLWTFHVPGAGDRARFSPGASARSAEQNGLGYSPQHDLAARPGSGGVPAQPPAVAEDAGDLSVLEPRRRVPSRPIRKVVVFGAGGPLAAATARELVKSYQLRLTDVRPIAQIAAEATPQSPGAPLPEVFGAPHETMEVDVSDLDQVMRACEGMDAIINCTVVRPHPVNAFLVNTVGAYNVMRAAVAHGIRRVVHTGPFQVGSDRPSGYWWDFDVPDDAPSRPGASLYLHSKALGQEIVRLFAEQYDLEVPTLVYCNFVNPEVARDRSGGLHPMTVSWTDAGRAMRRALEAPELSSPFEIIHILADLPHGKYSTAKARRILGWTPRDSLAHLWLRR